MRSFTPYLLLIIGFITSCTRRGGNEVLCKPPQPERFDFQIFDTDNNNLFDPGNPQHPDTVTFVNTCTQGLIATIPMQDSIGHFVRVNELNYSGPPNCFTCYKYLVKYGNGSTDTLTFTTEVRNPGGPCSPTIMKNVSLNGKPGEKTHKRWRTYFIFRM